MEFEWDDNKAQSCQEKRGITFTEAATVFGDPLALTSPDPDHSEDEERFVTFGYSKQNRLLVVARAERQKQNTHYQCTLGDACRKTTL